MPVPDTVSLFRLHDFIVCGLMCVTLCSPLVLLVCTHCVCTSVFACLCSLVQFGGHPLAYGVESTRWVKNKKRVVSLMPTPGSAPGAVPTPLFVIRSFGSWTRFFRIYNAATDEVVITVRTRDPSSSDKERLIRPHAFGWFGEDTSLAPFFSVDGDAWSSGCRAIGQPHREPLFTLSKLGLNCQYALLVEPHLDSALMLACTIGLLDLYGPASARII